MNNLYEQLKQVEPEEKNTLRSIIFDNISIEIYPNSIIFKDDICFFVGKKNGDKYLWISSSKSQLPDMYQGESIRQDLLCCPLNHHNANLIRQHFDFCRPKLIGLDDSFGFGDRLGIANPAHLRSLIGSKMKPILAQQSIRELQRTNRTPNEVMDAASWAVLQEGYKDGFGADADHLKTTDDIDSMVRAGYTFFTIDPSVYVINEADSLPSDEVEKNVEELPWDSLEDQFENCISRYESGVFEIDEEFVLRPNREEVLRGLLKYGGVIAHTNTMYHYLKSTYSDRPSEVELSVDETDSVTSPFEHLLVAYELKRLGVKLVSLAPRFVGDFEKGIDYKGDIELFKSEYLKHVKIAEKLGPYKISFHSGSDKFTVYEAVGYLDLGRVHVKTAGTSYLEALKTLAMKDPLLFREILEFSLEHFETEKRTYHVSADLARVPDLKDVSDEGLPGLFEQNDIRQILHVNFGKVLTDKDKNEDYLFRDRLLKCLEENEDVHYQNLIMHFKRHLKPFNK
jgi:hypothetical protein